MQRSLTAADVNFVSLQAAVFCVQCEIAEPKQHPPVSRLWQRRGAGVCRVCSAARFTDSRRCTSLRTRNSTD